MSFGSTKALNCIGREVNHREHQNETNNADVMSAFGGPILDQNAFITGCETPPGLARGLGFRSAMLLMTLFPKIFAVLVDVLSLFWSLSCFPFTFKRPQFIGDHSDAFTAKGSDSHACCLGKAASIATLMYSQVSGKVSRLSSSKVTTEGNSYCGANGAGGELGGTNSVAIEGNCWDFSKQNGGGRASARNSSRKDMESTGVIKHSGMAPARRLFALAAAHAATT